MATNPLFGRQMMNTFTSRVNSNAKESQRTKSKYGLATSVQVQAACAYCKKNHSLEDCEELRQKEPAARKDFIQEKGLCFGCLKTGHMARGCQQRSMCKICGKRHVTLLHQAGSERVHYQQRQSPVQPVKDQVTERQVGKEPQQVMTGCVREGNTGLAIVPVVIKAGDKSVITHALLDSGSTACFCQESLLQKLGLKDKNRTQLSLTTVCKDQLKIDSQIVTGLEVADLDGRHVLQLPAVYSLEKVPVDVSDIPRQEDVNRWSYLSEVYLPHVDAPVELMIGNNVPLAMEPWEVIHSQEGGPFATKTRLGWVINGPVRHDPRSRVKANRVHVEDEGLTELIGKLYNSEYSEKLADTSKGLSTEDKM